MKKNALLEQLESKNLNCTGCGCCQNICTQNAISMCEDDLGFLRPVICESSCVNCFQCLRNCPVLKKQPSIGNKFPECYAFCAEDSLRTSSSSGGVFSCLAEYVLSRGGCVFGAAIDNDMIVRHHCVEEPSQLFTLRKSKYVQSQTGLIYRQVKDKLSNGQLVLFTGTPCQIAALYSFLGLHPDNLITADILCHGVPSGKMLLDYLSQTCKSLPESIDFRPAESGWKRSSTCLKVTDANGKSQFLGRSQSAYEEGFHSGLILQQSCINCQFAEFPRQGDISMGDFWGIGDREKSLDDDGGTSVVLINTVQGAKAFRAILEQRNVGCLMRRVPLDWLAYNRIHAAIPDTPARNYFSFLYPRVGFVRAVQDASIFRAHIGIVGPWMNRNCGGALTYYGLYETLVEMGFQPLMISQPEGLEWSPDASACRYLKLPYPEYAIAPIQRDYAEQRKFSESIDTFVVGSDQLFTGTMLGLLEGYADLQWVSDEKRKIAYAASFAHDEFDGNDACKRSLRYFLHKFDAFSVREKSGVELVRRDFDIDAQWVVDPVFLCPIEKWNALADRGMIRVPSKPCVFGYILDPTPEKAQLLQKAAQKLNTSCLAATDPCNEADTVKQMWDIETLPNFANEEMLAQIRESKFVLTDSFHGVCFAIIFRKPFAVILNQKRGMSRFSSLLNLVDATNRIICSVDELSDDFFLPLGTNSENMLYAACAYSRDWLNKALTAPKDNHFKASDFEMSCNYTDRSIHMLQKRIKFMEDCLNGRIDWLIGRVDSELSVTDEKQWRQLEDHRLRLDGIDSEIQNLCKRLNKKK